MVRQFTDDVRRLIPKNRIMILCLASVNLAIAANSHAQNLTPRKQALAVKDQSSKPQALKSHNSSNVQGTSKAPQGQSSKPPTHTVPMTPLNLREVPLPVCERGLKNPRFVEAIDDHINSVFSGISMEDRLARSTIPQDLATEDRIQTLFSEIYTTDLRMKTNALIRKYNSSMPFHCLLPQKNGRGFAMHLSSSPCNDPDASFSSVGDVDSPRSRKVLRDLLRVGSGDGNANAGTQLLQACILHFEWDPVRKRYYTPKSTLSQASFGVTVSDGAPSTETKFQVYTQYTTLSRMECPLPTQMVLGCHIRLHPRSEKHIFRLTESDWMPAREAVICRLPQDTATAFDAEVDRLRQEIRQKPELRRAQPAEGQNTKDAQNSKLESEEAALVRILGERVQLVGKTIEELRAGALTFYKQIPCGHLSPGQQCNVIVSVKKHRYSGTLRDTFDYGILAADKKSVQMFREDMTMSPFNSDRSYHDVPGMVGRAFQFADQHGIYQAGGNPSHREVEMFCAEPKP